MEHYQIYRLDRGQWVLIRTRLESIQQARDVLKSIMVDTPGFAYQICKVSVVVEETTGEFNPMQHEQTR